MGRFLRTSDGDTIELPDRCSWEHYHEGYKFQRNRPMIQCKYCGDVQDHPLLIGIVENKIKPGSSGVTTGMGRHFKVCKRGPQQQENLKNGMSKFFRTSQPKQIITKDLILDKTLNFFISSNIAFNQADNPHFQALMSEIQVDGSPVTINCHNI